MVSSSPPSRASERPNRSRHPLERMASLLASLLDVHLQMALQEMSQERRRLIGGVLLMTMAIGLITISILLTNVALLVWLVRGVAWGLVPSLLIVSALDLVLAGLALRVGSVLLRGPYLTKTRAGLSKATRLLVGQ